MIDKASTGVFAIHLWQLSQVNCLEYKREAVLRTLSVLGSGVRTESSRFCCFLQEARKPPRAVNIELPTQCSMTIQRNSIKRKITNCNYLLWPQHFYQFCQPVLKRNQSTFLHLPRSPSGLRRTTKSNS